MGEYGVYALFRPDGRICYIGKGQEGRPRHHFRTPQKHRNKHLGRIITNAGGELHIKWLVQGLTETDALKEEVRLIAKFGRAPNGPLVNLTDGGEGVSGLKHSPETRAVLARKSSGVKQSAETIEKRAAKIRGTKRRSPTVEERAAHSQKIRGRKQTPQDLARQSAGMKGHSVSNETRAKIRARHLGRVHTEEARANMSAAHIGNLQPQYVRDKMTKSQKARWENNDTLRANISAKMKACWEDPKYVAKVMASRAKARAL